MFGDQAMIAKQSISGMRETGRDPPAAEADDYGGCWARFALSSRSSCSPVLPVTPSEAPSTLWKRRTRYVRGARPLHCSIKRTGKRAKARVENH